MNCVASSTKVSKDSTNPGSPSDLPCPGFNLIRQLCLISLRIIFYFRLNYRCDQARILRNCCRIITCLRARTCHCVPQGHEEEIQWLYWDNVNKLCACRGQFFFWGYMGRVRTLCMNHWVGSSVERRSSVVCCLWKRWRSRQACCPPSFNVNRIEINGWQPSFFVILLLGRTHVGTTQVPTTTTQLPSVVLDIGALTAITFVLQQPR